MLVIVKQETKFLPLPGQQEQSKYSSNYLGRWRESWGCTNVCSRL